MKTVLAWGIMATEKMLQVFQRLPGYATSGMTPTEFVRERYGLDTFGNNLLLGCTVKVFDCASFVVDIERWHYSDEMGCAIRDAVLRFSETFAVRVRADVRQAGRKFEMDRLPTVFLALREDI